MPSDSFEAEGGIPTPLRPIFFPGQRLADRDLTALVDWVRDRFALAARPSGWGVVCGFDLSVGSTAAGRPAIKVSPGLAVNAQGHPLVLSEEFSLALPDVKNRDRVDCPYPVKDPDFKPTVGPHKSVEGAKWSVYDLVLEPAEEETEAIASGSKCEHTRVRERAKPRFKPADADEMSTDPASRFDKPAVELFERCRPKKLFDTEYKATDGDKEVFSKWVRDEVSKAGRTSAVFPGLTDLLSETDFDFSDPKTRAEILFWLADAARRIPRACPGSATECVRLARVWLEVKGSAYAVRFVDAVPPARKEYGPDDASLDPHAYVGRPWNEVRTALARAGVRAIEEVFSPTDAKTLQALYRTERELVPGTSIHMLVLDSTKHEGAKPLAGRVIGFRSSSQLPAWIPPGPLTPAVYFPDPAASKPSFAIGPVPVGATLIPKDLTSLPAGGWIRLAIPTAPLGIPEGVQVKLYYFDTLTNEMILVKPAAPGELDSKTVVATVQLPKAAEAVEVRLIAEEEGGAKRTFLGNGVLKLQGSQEAIPVASIQAPTCELKPIGAGENPTQLVRLVGATDEKPVAIPFRISVADLASPNATVTLRYSPEPPDSTNAGISLGKPIPLSAMGNKATVVIPVPVSASVANPSLYFWLNDGKDQFLRTFANPEANGLPKPAEFTVKTIKMGVAVQNIAGLKATLRLAYAEGVFALVTGSATQLTPNPNTEVLKVEEGPPTKDKTFELTRTTGEVPWRIQLQFKVGADAAAVGAADNKVISAAIDVNPASEVVPAPVVGPTP